MKSKWPTSIFECAKQPRSMQNVRLSRTLLDKTIQMGGQRDGGKVNRRAPSSLLELVINFVVKNVILSSFRAKCFQEANDCGN